MEERAGCFLYKTYFKVLDSVSGEECQELVRAIGRYSLEGKMTKKFSGKLLESIWLCILPSLQRGRVMAENRMKKEEKRKKEGGKVAESAQAEGQDKALSGKENVPFPSTPSQSAISEPVAASVPPEAATSAPVKSAPVKSEPAKAEPIKTAPVKSEPAKAEPIKTAPVKSEAATSAPIKSAPVKSEPAKPVVRDNEYGFDMTEDEDYVQHEYTFESLTPTEKMQELADKEELEKMGIVVDCCIGDVEPRDLIQPFKESEFLQKNFKCLSKIKRHYKKILAGCYKTIRPAKEKVVPYVNDYMQHENFYEKYKSAIVNFDEWEDE